MHGSWLGLIELVLVFGLVALWCWNELRVLKRDNAAAARRAEAGMNDADPPPASAPADPPD